jgi:Sap, sulfolipid-1-addressing protein
VPVQLIPLAVLAAITSPTAIAAVLVILNRPHPRRLLTGYVVGSFVMSVLIGIVVVVGLAATTLLAPRHRASLPVLDIAVGVLILVSAAWLHSPRSAEVRKRASIRHAQRRAERQARRGDRPTRTAQVLASGSIGLVTALGAAMHLPGLLYLAALGTIAHANLSTTHTLVVLVLFNLVMLAPVELPLAGSIVAPHATQDAVRRIDAYVKAHRNQGILLGSILAAGYLILAGLLTLAF